MTSQRSNKLELIDKGPSYYSAKEYRDCLYQLDKIGRFLGGDRATYWALNQVKPPPDSILDVGCGGGLFTIRLAAAYPNAKVTGIDISADAIAFAKEHLKQYQPPLTNIEFYIPNQPDLDHITEQFDIVMATLVCHHLSDQELISFLQQACRISKKAVILNDLHRHSLATVGFSLLAPFCFPNRLILHDGLLSIKRAFHQQDWWSFLEKAGIDKRYCSVSWHWAFRWIVMIDTAAMKR